MKQKVAEYAVLFLLGILLTSASAWTSGYLQVAKAAKYFYTTRGGAVQASTTLEELTAKVSTGILHEEEIQAIQTILKTKTGECEITEGQDHNAVLISRRMPYRKGDKITITNLSRDDARSIDVVIVGDFLPKEPVIVAVSRQLAQTLGFESGKIQVEVRPAK